jgi:hypothetical protein
VILLVRQDSQATIGLFMNRPFEHPVNGSLSGA